MMPSLLAASLAFATPLPQRRNLAAPALARSHTEPQRRNLAAPALARTHSLRTHPVLLSAAAAPSDDDAEELRQLRQTLLPVWLIVFVQMLGVGVTISTLPLYLLSIGASTMQLSAVLSGFAAAQMIGAPLLVRLSDRIGRSSVLLVCIAGAAAANLMTAAATGYRQVAAARVLAGLFAATTPVAQAATTDLVEAGPKSTRALGLLQAAVVLGVTVGPAFASAAAGAFAAAGVADSAARARAIFALNAALALVALGVGLAQGLGARSPVSASAATATAVEDGAPAPPPAVGGARTQLCLRALAFIVGWSITLTVATYSVFASRRLGYGQREIGLLYSAAACAALLANTLALPRLVGAYGERVTCAIGLLLLGTCATGTGIVLTPPWHALLFIMRGAGVALTDTTIAALIARYSPAADKATNLGLSSSVQAGARLVAPLASGAMLDMALGGGVLGPAGANGLPFVVVGGAATLAAAVPLVALPRLEQTKGE